MQDDMQNAWGTHYINPDGPAPTKDNSTSKDRTNDMIKEMVPGFKLETIVANGSTANEKAIWLGTGSEPLRCMAVLGNYVGGTMSLEGWSTATGAAKKSISVVVLPEDATRVAQAQTVVLPYHITCGEVSDTEIITYENECFQHVKEKLLFAKMFETPYKALLLELMLTGNGGELSDRFLCRLGVLLKEFNVIVIVDEVMTGGRMGPLLCKTSTTPVEFRDCVQYITLGKIFQAGLVLSRWSGRVTAVPAYRGTTTSIDQGGPYRYLVELEYALANGGVRNRRRTVLSLIKKMKEKKKDKLTRDRRWGRGTFIFTSWKRPESKGNLYCRMLPVLGDTKVRLMGMVLTKWTRSSVCIMLMKAGRSWIEFARERINPGATKFTQLHLAAVKAVIKVNPNPTSDGIQPCRVVESMEKSLGKKRLASFALEFRKDEQRRKKARVCGKPDPLLSVQVILRKEKDRENLEVLIKGWRRRQMYFFVDHACD